MVVGSRRLRRRRARRNHRARARSEAVRDCRDGDLIRDSWPTTSSERTGSVTVLDVDRVGDVAVVLMVTDAESSRTGYSLLETRLAQYVDGVWGPRGGGASGSGEDPMIARTQRPPAAPLQSLGRGGTSLEPEKRRGRWFWYTEVLCSAAVARVDIARGDERRTADVSTGPGWLIVAWLEDMDPTLTACDATGQLLSVLHPEASQLEQERRRRRARRRPRRGRIVTIDDPVLTDLHDRERAAETPEERRALHDQIHKRLRELHERKRPT